MLTALFWKIHASIRCQGVERKKKVKMVKRRQIFTFNSLRPILAVEWWRTHLSPIFDGSGASALGLDNWCLWANHLQFRKLNERKAWKETDFSWNFSPSVCKMPLFSVVVDTVFTYINKHESLRNVHFSPAQILTSLDEKCLLNCVPSSTGFRKI